jgi:hypothetical protein
MKNKITYRTRVYALTLLSVFLCELFLPTVAFALSGREHQVEYMSYESFGSTDLVNLQTGDFTYNIPIVNIPGPEGSFQLPLAYHGGIGLEEEASWTGLGWSINAGSISRSVSGIPDDFAGQVVSETSKQSGGSSFYDYINLGLAAYSYDKERGVGVRASFPVVPGVWVGLGYGSMDQATVSVAGLTAGYVGDKTVLSGYGFSFERDWHTGKIKSNDLSTEQRIVSALSSAASLVGVAAGESTDANIWTKIASSDAFGIANKSLLTYSAASIVASNFSHYYLGVNQGYFSAKNTRKGIRTKTKWNYLKSTSETTFGAIYSAGINTDHLRYDGTFSSFSVVPSHYHYNSTYDIRPSKVIRGPGSTPYTPKKYSGASDIFENFDENSPQELKPIHIAYDDFSVSASGVSGLIQPYRVDLGSVSHRVKRKGRFHGSYHLNSFLPYQGANKYIPQFRYLGAGVNHYDNHKGGTVYNPFHAGVRDLGLTDPHSSSLFTLRNDNVFDNASFENTDRADGSYVNKKLRFGNHIEWATNWDLMSTGLSYSPSNYNGSNPLYTNRIMDHLLPAQRASLRTSMPKLGIGGFAITNSQGITYHFTLPIYSENNRLDIYKDANNFTAQTTHGKYAVTWLLTGITGSDFIDRNLNGTIDDDDFGFWVKMDYGKFSGNYRWSDPYTGRHFTTDDHQRVFKQSGKRETYYLNEISTRTHKALFVKSLREDGKSAYDKAGGILPSSSLKLDEIITLSNKDFDFLVSQGMTKTTAGDNTSVTNGDSFDFVWNENDISSYRTQIADFQLNKKVFNYLDYKDQNVLCNETYNSFADPLNPPNSFNNTVNGGKLTLSHVEFYGRNDTKLHPDYNFEYSSNNFAYNPNKFNAWGSYIQSGGDNTTSHGAVVETPDVYCLTKVIDPSGKELIVEYEADEYSSLVGEKIGLKVNPLNYNASSNTITIKNTNIDLTDYYTVGEDIYVEGLLDVVETETYERYKVKQNLANFILNIIGCFSFNLKLNNGQLSFSFGDLETVPNETKTRDLDKEVTFNDNLNITSVTANTIELSGFSSSLWSALGTSGCGRTEYQKDIVFGCQLKSVKGHSVDIPHVFTCSPTLKYVTLELKQKNKLGGNGRVSTIAIQNDQGVGAVKKYVYNDQSDLSGGVSSGYVTSEPPFAEGFTYDFQDHYTFPQTPVQYSKVGVYSNFESSDNSYSAKEEFEFIPVSTNMITETKQTSSPTSFGIEAGDGGNKAWTLEQNAQYSDIKITHDFSLVGQLKSQVTKNSEGQVISSTKYNFAKNNKGRFTKGVISLEAIATDYLVPETDEEHFFVKYNPIRIFQESVKISMNSHGPKVEMLFKLPPPPNIDMEARTMAHKFVRTVEEEQHSRLVSMETEESGIKTKRTYTSFDPVNGQVLETEFSNSKGDRLQTRIIPAYAITDASNNKLYSKMGSKFDDPTNKNVLNALGAEYLSIYDELSDQWSPINAQVHTWDNNWMYRNYDSGDNVFEQTETQTNDAYRKKSTYTWNGLSNSDGTFNNFVDFDWTSTLNPDWIKTSEYTLYDRYSHVLELTDLNNRASSMKMNNNNSLVIASAVNARYDEFAYSGAEDVLSSNGTFGGEVFKGGSSSIIDVSIEPNHVHTGNKALRVDNGGFGYVFKKEFAAGEAKRYRTSVWIHQDNMDQLRLVYTYENGGGSVKYKALHATAANSYLKAGEWYLLVLDVPGAEDAAVATATKLSIQTWCPSIGTPTGSVYIDDFKVFPYDGSMSATVYDERTGEIMASINAMGLAEKYEYDASGRLIRTYQEIPDYNGKVGGFKLRNKYDYDYKRNY